MPIHVDLERRVIEDLPQTGVSRARDHRNVAFEPQRAGRASSNRRAHLHLHVDRRGEAKVQDLTDHVRLLEVQGRAPKVVPHPMPDAVHHLHDVAVFGLQANRDLGVRFGGVLQVSTNPRL